MRENVHWVLQVALTVQPRVQKEKWSLYWKESMSTKTDCLDAFQLEVEPNTTIAEVRQLPEEASVRTCLFATGNTKQTACHARFGCRIYAQIGNVWNHCSSDTQ